MKPVPWKPVLPALAVVVSVAVAAAVTAVVAVKAVVAATAAVVKAAVVAAVLVVAVKAVVKSLREHEECLAEADAMLRSDEVGWPVFATEDAREKGKDVPPRRRR